MQSKNWKMWYSVEDVRRCLACERNTGKIYGLKEKPNPSPKLHLHCRCWISVMQAVYAGSASDAGFNGADWWIRNQGQLPGHYIEYVEAIKLGWEPWKGDLGSVLPGRIIGGGVYMNRNGHLPSAPGRIWYEADINYTGGYRSTDRILFSNDGLIFATYDHYQTFVEVV